MGGWLVAVIIGLIIGFVVGAWNLSVQVAIVDNRERDECIAKHSSATCIQIWTPTYTRGGE